MVAHHKTLEYQNKPRHHDHSLVACLQCLLSLLWLSGVAGARACGLHLQVEILLHCGRCRQADVRVSTTLSTKMSKVQAAYVAKTGVIVYLYCGIMPSHSKLCSNWDSRTGTELVFCLNSVVTNVDSII